MLSASQQNTTPHHHESHQEQDVFDIVKAGKGKVCTIIVTSILDAQTKETQSR